MLPLFLLWPTDIITTPLIGITLSVPEIPSNVLSCLCSAVGLNGSLLLQVCSLISVMHMHYWVNHKLQRNYHFYQIKCSTGTYFTCGIYVSANLNLKIKTLYEFFPFCSTSNPCIKTNKENQTNYM